MKKLIFIFLLFLSTHLLAQNYQVDYYGAGKPGSDALIIPDADSVTSEYWVMGQIILLQVEDWTASNIGFEVWNPKSSAWELLTDGDGTVIEYTVTEGQTIGCKPIEMAGLQRIRFKKITSGSGVAQSGNAGYITVHTILF